MANDLILFAADGLLKTLQQPLGLLPRYLAELGQLVQQKAGHHTGDDLGWREGTHALQAGSVEAFRPLVQELVEEVDEERHRPLKSVEILRRARLEGYEGGKSALYELIAELRPHATRVMMRFEGVPGEFSQHDFGEVRVVYLDGTSEVVRFFGSRLKWSRWAAVDPRAAPAAGAAPPGRSACLRSGWRCAYRFRWKSPRR